MNLPPPSAETQRPPRTSKDVIVVMLVIVGGMALLAIFANVQNFRQGQVETVAVRTATSPTPQSR